MKNKKKIIIIGFALLIIALLLIMQVNNISKKSKVINGKTITPVKEQINGDMLIDYKEGIYLSNKDKYLEFELTGNSEEDIIYDINIKDGKETSGKTRIDNKKIKFSLMKKVNNSEFITVVENKSYDDLKNYYRMFTDVMPKGDNIKHIYRLYMGIENIDENSYANVEVKVSGNVAFKYKPIG